MKGDRYMFSNEELQQMIDGKSIGHQYPYNTNNEQEIEAHIRRLFYRLIRIPNLIIEAEWDHFGSGYASFVELFCYQKENVLIVKKINDMQKLEIHGIIIDVCRLAPVVIMGEDERFKTIDMITNKEISGGYGTLLDGPIRLHLSEKLLPLERELKLALDEFKYEVLDENTVSQPLSFQTNIPTLYRASPAYKVMDALFYWED